MKKYRLLLSLIIAIVLQSCSNNPNKEVSDQLSTFEKSQISSEIIDFSNQWINDNKNMDSDKAIKFWSKSPDLRFAENGQFFANRDSIYSILNYYYSITNTFNAGWLNRKITPISNSVALLSGDFYFKLNLTDGSTFQGTNIFTGVFIKKNGEWSLIQGQEALKEE